MDHRDRCQAKKCFQPSRIHCDKANEISTAVVVRGPAVALGARAAQSSSRRISTQRVTHSPSSTEQEVMHSK